MKKTSNDNTILFKQASLTIEATLVMILVIAVIAFIIYEGLYMYDRCIMKGASYRGTVKASNMEIMKRRTDTGILVKQTEQMAGTVFFGKPIYSINKKSGAWCMWTKASRNLNGSTLLKKILNNTLFTVNMESRCYSPNRERIIRSTKAVIKLKGKER